MSGNLKLNTPSAGSVTLSTADTASNVTVTIPAATDTATLNAQTQTLTNKTLVASGSNSVEATAGPTATQLAGNRNKIINGAMMIDQRNAGASVTQTATFLYSVDRFGISGSVTSKFTAQQSTTAPVGFTNSLLCTSSSAYSVGSSDSFSIQQRIEGLNCSDLAWGTANAASITLSFWVRSSLTGTFGGSLRNSAADRSYPFTFVINAANTWEQKTVTIAGDTSGTWLTSTGIGIIVSFSLGAGSTLSGSSGSWSANNYVSATGATSVVGTNGATFYITGVQLEKGATATPFENRLYGTELALAQRYFVKFGGTSAYEHIGVLGTAYSTISVTQGIQLPVIMRAAPSISAATLLVSDGVTNTACTSFGLASGGAETSPLVVGGTFTTAGGLTQYRPYQVYANNSTSAYYNISAEL